MHIPVSKFFTPTSCFTAAPYMHARLLNLLDSSQLAPKCDESSSVENDDEY